MTTSAASASSGKVGASLRFPGADVQPWLSALDDGVASATLPVGGDVEVEASSPNDGYPASSSRVPPLLEDPLLEDPLLDPPLDDPPNQSAFQRHCTV